MKVTVIAILLFVFLSVACGHRYGYGGYYGGYRGYSPYYKKVYKVSKPYGYPHVHHPLKVGYGHGLHIASPGAHVAISGAGFGNGVYVASNPGATHVAPLYG